MTPFMSNLDPLRALVVATVVVAVPILLFGPEPASADVVIMHNGDRLTGDLIRQDAGRLELKTAYAGTLDIVESAGTGFAVPSRTLYHTRDAGLNAERRQDAEKEVREWAAAHELPFPEFAADHRDRIMDTLDYPPEGSPGADRG